MVFPQINSIRQLHGRKQLEAGAVCGHIYNVAIEDARRIDKNQLGIEIYFLAHQRASVIHNGTPPRLAYRYIAEVKRARR